MPKEKITFSLTENFRRRIQRSISDSGNEEVAGEQSAFQKAETRASSSANYFMLDESIAESAVNHLSTFAVTVFTGGLNCAESQKELKEFALLLGL